MTPKERTELARLTKARFRLLKMQARARAYEIAAAEQQREELAAEEQSREFRDRLDALNELAKPLYDKVQDVIREADEAGLQWQGSTGGWHVSNVKFTSKAARSKFRLVDSVEKAVVIEIERMEIDVLEQLLVGELESEEAKTFLGRIPTIEGLASGEQVLELVTAS